MKNYFKTGMFVLLGLGLTIACDDDDTTPVTNGSAITNVSFTAVAGGDGTEITVTPSSTGGTTYSVDFGDAAAENDADVMSTAGPAVMYNYPNATATYSVTVTASATGADDVTKSQDVTVTYEEPDVSPLAGTWVLKHDIGSMFVGPDTEKGTPWWQNNPQTILDRSCLYDDKYEFKADFSFENKMGDETWINWGGDGQPENCGTPESPMDGTGSYTYSHDQENNTLTLSGKGAHLGLAKVVNGAYLNSASDAAETITYDIISVEQDEFEVRITWDNGGTDAYWFFTFAREGSIGADFDQTDTDNDGVIDFYDVCPEEAAPNTTDGCPVENPPTDAPTAPTVAEDSVLSIFSDAYTDLEGTNFNPGWGQNTIASKQTYANNEVLEYKNLNYQGTEFASSDVTGYTKLHLDYWTEAATFIKVSLISEGKENAVELTVTTGGWQSVDIDLSQYTEADKTVVIQLKVEGDATIYLDNIYFY